MRYILINLKDDTGHLRSDSLTDFVKALEDAMEGGYNLEHLDDLFVLIDTHSYNNLRLYLYDVFEEKVVIQVRDE